MSLNELKTSISENIDNYCVTKYLGGFRSHLGASLINNECYRYLQLSFRWAFKPEFTARQLRLFNHGHRTEERFEEWLTGAGYSISTINPDTNTQYSFTAHMGHYGGSCDGKIKLENETGLLEFKTNCTGRGFGKLFEEPLETAKPDHWGQVCTYGFHMDLSTVVYLNLNKNDDDLFVGVEALDHSVGMHLNNKAEVIIFTDDNLPKIGKSESFYKCKMCSAKNVCFGNKPFERNCRSCINSEPVENAQWSCKKYNSVIPEDQIENEYDCWESFFK